MSLVTGSAAGTTVAQESLYMYGSPYVYIQDATAAPFYNPDAQGFYWQMTGTATYNVYEIGCPTNVSLADNLASNDILCDHIGMVGQIQQRNSIDFTLSVQSLLPLSTLRILLKGGAVTRTTGNSTEKFGFGPIDNNQYWHLYMPKVYDENAADYVWQYFHKCQFVDAWTINMTFGKAWEVTGIKLRAFADSTMPSAQSFGMWGRCDLSVVV